MGPEYASSLQRLISAKRYKQYTAVFGGDQKAGAALYLLDIEVRGALLELLHFIELPLRDAIHRDLSAVYFKRWYERSDILDSRTTRSFEKAKGELGKYLGKEPDRVVAQVSLGTWTALLETGGPIKDAAGNFVAASDYERDLWHPALAGTFSGLAKTREDAEVLLRRVRRARNRVAHHESVVFGVHQIGERDGTKLVRQSPHSMIADVRALIAHLAPDMKAWLDTCKHVEELLGDQLAVDALAYAHLKRNAAWV
jgi:hypothetical protein